MATHEEIEKAVRGAAVERDGRMTLACPAAFDLAATFGVERKVVGEVCNEQKIKIVECQLGCFP